MGKNKSVFLSILLLLLMLGACGIKPDAEMEKDQTVKEAGNTADETTEKMAEDTDVIVTSDGEEQSEDSSNHIIVYQVECVRVGSDYFLNEATVVNSLAELNQYFQYPLPDQANQLLEKYDEQWFNSHILIITTHSMSGVERCEVKQIYTREERLIVSVDIIHTEWEKLSEAEQESLVASGDRLASTADVHVWGAFIEIDKQDAVLIEAVEEIVVEETYIPNY